MKTKIIGITLCMLMITTGFSSFFGLVDTAKADLGDILETYDVPSGCQPGGMTWDGSNLWLTDMANDKIYKLDSSCNVIGQIDSPDNKPAGLAWDGSHFWNVDTGYGSPDHDKLYKLDTNGNILATYNLPGCWGYGLTFDGSYLWHTDFGFNKVYKINPSNGQYTEQFDTPDDFAYGMAWDGTNLYIAAYGTIYQMDTSGNIITNFAAPYSCPAGLTYDGTFLWNVDDCLLKIYKIDANLPPNTPSKPSGTTNGNTGTTYLYETSTTDPNGNQIYYWFDWDDGTNSGWVGPFNSGTTGSAYKCWNSPGTYYVKVKAKDEYDLSNGQWSDSLAVNIQNSPPNTPSTPSGPTSGNPGTSYEYTSSATDPDGDWVSIKFSWGDGTESDWSDLVAPGTPVSASHSWSSPGTYNVKAKAKDSLDGESGWSSAKSVAIVGNPSVTTNDATGITSSGATLNGNLDNMGGASTCEVWFEWGLTTSYGQETTHQTKTSTGSFSESISGLNPDTTYHFRAVASNSYGTVYGGDKTFTTPLETAEWTFMVYLCGDNNLDPFGRDDINEMEAAGSTDDVHFIVLFDGDGNGDSILYRINHDSNGYDTTIISTVLDDGGAIIGDSNEVNMGDPDTLENFADWVFSNYPANRYAIDLWNHGNGWKNTIGEEPTKHVCEDDTSGGDALEMNELRSAFSTITNNGNDKIDLIGFDACLMQMIEVEYQIKEFGEYMVGSEEVEPGDGWDYQSSCTALKNDPTKTAKKLGEKIVLDYHNSGGSTLSVVDLSAVATLANDISSLGSALMDDSYHSNIDTAIQTAESYTINDYKDLYDFASIIQDLIDDNTIDSLAQAVMNHVDAAVTYEKHSSAYSDSHGISIYIPLNDFLIEYEDLIFAQDTDWDQFIKWFTNDEPNKPKNPSPSDGATDVSLDPYLSVTATDPDEDKMTVIFYDASTNSEIGRQNNVDSGSTATCQWSNRVPHTTYQWYAKANDGWKSVKSDTWSFTTGDAPNQRPGAPRIVGPSRVKINQVYPYKFTATDPENHDLYYYVEWGDETNSGWLGPYTSGETIELSHSWSEHGSVTIKAKAKDIHDDESDWGYLPITKRRSILFVDILENFFEKHPNMFPLVRTLLQRIGL